MKPEREVRYLKAAELRVEGDSEPVITGYAAVFDSDSLDLGGFVERIKEGAFARTLKEGADVRALVDHDASKIIGRNKAGTLELKEDKHGLHVRIKPPDTTSGRDIVTSIRRGDVDGMSFGFVANEYRWKDDVTPVVRTLLDVDLFDVSVVTYPAYPDTSVAVRSLEEARKASPKSAVTEAIETATTQADKTRAKADENRKALARAKEARMQDRKAKLLAEIDSKRS